MTVPNDEAPLAKAEGANRRVALVCGGLAVGMLGLAYAAVPLYAMFCQATGYGGTPQRALAPSTSVIDRTITVMFDANVNAALPWTFEPVERTVTLRLGETGMGFYRATNRSDHAVTGRAVFNVAPEAAAIHFNKIECFCFKEQTLGPGETVEMPVTFYVDPALASDPDARTIPTIVLSYTFHPVAEPKPATAAKPEASQSKGT